MSVKKQNKNTRPLEPLKWRFDVSTFRLLGRDLITDRITALFELVKNCYDANAKRVDVEFYHVNSINGNSKIIIKDDGIGMTFADIRDKWMVIGTASKRESKYSPAPFNRRYVGEKGIGRFAVDKIGEKVNIITKKKGDPDRLNVEINWNTYENLANKAQLTLFTDVENAYRFEPANPNIEGTILEIRQIREVWTDKDLERLYKELTKIVSPFHPLNPPFKIYISSNEYDYNNTLVEADAIKYASHHGEITFNSDERWQEVLRFDNTIGRIIIDRVPLKSFGGVKMQLYYFNSQAKKRYHAQYKGDETRIDGIKIYRDGLITTPFAEFEAHPDRKRDILGIDKRLWRDIFNRISTRDIIGVLDITKEGNPKIIDATNRQDFIDNPEYRDLKAFIIEQLESFSQLRIYERSNERQTADNNLRRASEDVTNFTQTLDDISNENPQLKDALEPLKQQANQVKESVKKGFVEYKKAQKEFIRKENIYLSLMSLQEYATNIAHAVRTTLGKVKHRAEFFMTRYPNQDLERYFKLYAVEIFTEMQTLNKVIDFMLSYAGSNLAFEDFSVRDLVTDLFQHFQLTFEHEGINAQVDIRDNFTINGNKYFFTDIFQNLINNSIKALKGIDNKLIKCTGHIEQDSFILFFSDNGRGIPQDLWNKVFELYFTTTAEYGGAGLGLFIVKTRIEALKGTVEVCENELKPHGATFKITFPFKKEA